MEAWRLALKNPKGNVSNRLDEEDIGCEDEEFELECGWAPMTENLTQKIVIRTELQLDGQENDKSTACSRSCIDIASGNKPEDASQVEYEPAP